MKNRALAVIELLKQRANEKIPARRYVNYQDLKAFPFTQAHDVMAEVKKLVKVHEIWTDSMTSNGRYREFALAEAVCHSKEI